jgi:hypothetical protein
MHEMYMEGCSAELKLVWNIQIVEKKMIKVVSGIIIALIFYTLRVSALRYCILVVHCNQIERASFYSYRIYEVGAQTTAFATAQHDYLSLFYTS